MKANALIFDKDGTLIEFDAFWVSLSIKAIQRVLDDLNIQGELSNVMEAFGVHDGVTDINGVLCHGTYAQMGEIVYDILKKHNPSLSKEQIIYMVENAYKENVCYGEVKPTTKTLKNVLERLKKGGKKLAVVTTDNEIITRTCLKKLGIEQLFDKIYTDNGTFPPKPNPFCANDFCESFGLDKDQVVMVGDTMTDVKFAKNAGIKIVSLAQKEENRAKLCDYADVVVDDLTKLLEIIE